MNWQEVCEHPSLQDLPFKIETNERGEIVMAPVKVYHSAYQGELGFLLRSLRSDGKVLAECAIHTAKGTKVADVAWCSTERFQQIKDETECSIAPEVCVEVLSLSNTDSEIQEKRQLYFDRGAVEVWTCHADGSIHFYHAGGKLEQSLLFPKFPLLIEI
ncbi:MAG: Uma2 family endonuclease [Deltaproteobacteria bacterium]|nr:Uma2 family endonuclease [Deltaproteobacteria bacterium]